MKVELVENINFTGLTYRNMGTRLLIGEERTQRQQPTAEWLPAQKSWDSRGHCIVYTEFNRLENVLSATRVIPQKNTTPIKNQQENLLCQEYMFQHAWATDLTQRQSSDPKQADSF